MAKRLLGRHWRRLAVGLAGLGVGEVVAAAGGSSLVDGVGRAVVDWAPWLGLI